jgi:transcriptional regulator with GAF, ATPase, and Fis domain
MESNSQASDRLALEEARKEIALLRAELEEVRGSVARERYAEQLTQAMTLAASAGNIASPVSHSRLLEMIVEVAAHVISASAASLFLIDNETNELVFEVALGPKAHEVKKFRVPLGHGIAGLVALTGQPMAVADAQHDPRQASDIAQSVGYTPRSILCVPLFYNDEVTGVLQLLDKVNSEAFTSADMEILGMFANQAAVAIEQSRTHQNLAALIGEVLSSVGAAAGETDAKLQNGLRSFAGFVEADASYNRALELARLIQEIVWQGESEAEVCKTILRGFTDYLRLRSAQASELGTTGL